MSFNKQVESSLTPAPPIMRLICLIGLDAWDKRCKPNQSWDHIAICRQVRVGRERSFVPVVLIMGDHFSEGAGAS